MVTRSIWGRGYATEAARAILDFAFWDLYIDRLIATVHPANRASIRVLDKMGAQLTDRPSDTLTYTVQSPIEIMGA